MGQVTKDELTQTFRVLRDQRHENATVSAKRQQLEAPTELNPDVAGLGMFYCVECDRHFPNNNDREAHLASKLHKRIAKKVLNEKPYTHEEAMRGAGIGVENKRRDTQEVELDI